MQSHRHHLRRNHTFGEQHLDESRRNSKNCALVRCSPDELGVVGRERVRHHEVMRAAFPDPERQLVGIGIVVVEKAAFLDEKPSRIQGSVRSGSTSRGAGADALADGLDGVPDPAALGVLVELVVLLPAETVRADVVAAFAYLRAQASLRRRASAQAKTVQGMPADSKRSNTRHAATRSRTRTCSPPRGPVPGRRGLRAELGEGALGSERPRPAPTAPRPPPR